LFLSYLLRLSQFSHLCPSELVYGFPHSGRPTAPRKSLHPMARCARHAQLGPIEGYLQGFGLRASAL
jgi:hypothetical protein